MASMNTDKTKKFRQRQSQRYSDEVIHAARYLYLKKYTPAEIRQELKLPSTRPIYYWADKYQWRALLDERGVEELIALRIMTLTDRENKSELEIKELESLIDRHIHYKKQQAKQLQNPPHFEQDNLADGLPDKQKKRAKQRKNDISHVTPEMVQPFIDTLFSYQRLCRENKHQKVRNILKSRQIGATYYFAFEALEDAIFTGDNQIFLSASKRQAEIFLTYIRKMALQFFEVELKGNPIILSNGAELHFLATNKNTAQGYHGHIYGDEYAWLRNFKDFYTVASAMATHKKWRETYFSTPSSKMHEAYQFWSGEDWRGNDTKRKSVKFPAFNELRDGGRLCPDGQWRYVVTIEDAIKGGADVLFDIEALRQKYNQAAFNQLFMCIWVDDSDSIFTISKLLNCAVNTDKWKDFDKNSNRPLGEREVWAGYDPAHSTDGASFVIVSPPMLPKEKYRILERHQWHGLSYKYQAEQIRKLTQKYNVSYIGIDTTGVGYGVYEMLQEFARRQATPILYHPDTKAELVLKVHDLVEHSRIEWSEDEIDIPAAFLMIKQTTTRSGDRTTFIADRTAKNQHADVFWAIANAVNKRELNDSKPKRSKWSL